MYFVILRIIYLNECLEQTNHLKIEEIKKSKKYETKRRVSNQKMLNLTQNANIYIKEKKQKIQARYKLKKAGLG